VTADGVASARAADLLPPAHASSSAHAASDGAGWGDFSTQGATVARGARCEVAGAVAARAVTPVVVVPRPPPAPVPVPAVVLPGLVVAAPLMATAAPGAVGAVSALAGLETVVSLAVVVIGVAVDVFAPWGAA
jgi:hypothetical protein